MDCRSAPVGTPSSKHDGSRDAGSEKKHSSSINIYPWNACVCQSLFPTEQHESQSIICSDFTDKNSLLSKGRGIHLNNHNSNWYYLNVGFKQRLPAGLTTISKCSTWQGRKWMSHRQNHLNKLQTLVKMYLKRNSSFSCWLQFSQQIMATD